MIYVINSRGRPVYLDEKLAQPLIDQGGVILTGTPKLDYYAQYDRSLNPGTDIEVKVTGTQEVLEYTEL